VESNSARANKEALALRSKCTALEKSLADQRGSILMKEKALEEQTEKDSSLKQEIALQLEQIRECDKEKTLFAATCSERQAALEKAEVEVEVLKRVELDLTRKLSAAQQVQSDLRDELVEREFKKKRAREEEVRVVAHSVRFYITSFYFCHQEVAAASGAGSDSILRLQYNKMRETLLCGVCKERYKDTCIAKCFHTFCSECVPTLFHLQTPPSFSLIRCVSSRLGSRNRKCPQCSAAFSDNQVTSCNTLRLSLPSESCLPAGSSAVGWLGKLSRHVAVQCFMQRRSPFAAAK
jgi:E3 ubiquitin-protein ligase BRE1